MDDDRIEDDDDATAVNWLQRAVLEIQVAPELELEIEPETGPLSSLV
jgi:hypothetical protein